MRSLLTAGLLAGLALASPVLAQDAATGRRTAGQGLRRRAPCSPPSTAPTITLGHVIALRDRLPPQYQNLPDDVLMNGLLDQLVDQQLLADGAVGLAGERPAAGEAAARERAARRAGRASPPSAAVADAVDDAKVQAAYDKQVADFQPQPEFNAAHILVDSEDKAKALKAEIDGGKDFAEVAKANSSDGSAATGGDLGWFGAGPDGAGVRDGGAAHGGRARSPARSRSQFGWHLIKLNDKRETAAADARRGAAGDREPAAPGGAARRSSPSCAPAATIEKPETGTPPAAIRESDLLTN